MIDLHEGYSDCCGANVNMPDQNGHGHCQECGEHCTTAYDEEDEILEENTTLEEKLEKAYSLDGMFGSPLKQLSEIKI